MKEIIKSIVASWKNTKGNVNATEDVILWINKLNKETFVDIKECKISDSTFWFYDDYNGEILNRKRSFFSIKGMRNFVDDKFVCEQPVIIQPEIGYLGIICKIIDGELNFLMQAKIEPGNVNCVQISPTIQATKSNFTRAHGGKLPTYFEYFENSGKYQVIYDQIQSEQSARFYKKRNRNMIMLIEDDIQVYANYKWLTLGQIKELMKIDNLVNMDTRTVLSGIPFVTTRYEKEDLEELKGYFTEEAFFRSIFCTDMLEDLRDIYQYMNNYKMFHEVKTKAVPLNELVDWQVDEKGVTCKKEANFKVRFYDISISGREVQKWTQPLFKAIGNAVFGLITCVDEGVRKYLVCARPEIGSFDKIELGPSIQREPIECSDKTQKIERVFEEKLQKQEGIVLDVLLSEEGGRFYHEQNRNVIMEVEKQEIGELPEGYFWVNYSSLNYLVQVNNCLNIQLRNLLSLLEV
ncbi:MAG: NDP-hexose 2,3-dehydratase family protein [Lachnospiraceae bacterium]|nr:NDP-hexose 2,3-dehydratase family protein [Lachnospiraceae bacterium]